MVRQRAGLGDKRTPDVSGGTAGRIGLDTQRRPRKACADPLRQAARISEVRAGHQGSRSWRQAAVRSASSSFLAERPQPSSPPRSSWPAPCRSWLKRRSAGVPTGRLGPAMFHVKPLPPRPTLLAPEPALAHLVGVPAAGLPPPVKPVAPVAITDAQPCRARHNLPCDADAADPCGPIRLFHVDPCHLDRRPPDRFISASQRRADRPVWLGASDHIPDGRSVSGSAVGPNFSPSLRRLTPGTALVAQERSPPHHPACVRRRVPARLRPPSSARSALPGVVRLGYRRHRFVRRH
jgi:hypothetical protein